MDIDRALEIISEIAEGELEREAFETVKSGIVELIDQAEHYRHRYEGAVKKMEHLRDIAYKTDL